VQTEMLTLYTMLNFLRFVKNDPAVNIVYLFHAVLSVISVVLSVLCRAVEVTTR